MFVLILLLENFVLQFFYPSKPFWRRSSNFSFGYLDFTGVCNFDVDGEIISCKDQIIEIFLISSSSLYK